MIMTPRLRRALGVMLLVGTPVAGTPVMAQDTPAVSDSPLETLRAEREAAEARDRARLAELVDDEQALDAALERARADLAEARERREALESRQQAQRDELEALNARRQEQGGDLEAVFDAVADASGELRDDLAGSWLTLGAETALPPRLDPDAILATGQLATLADSLMGLTRETARVVALEAPVAGADGQVAERPVLRLGDLLAASQGQLLERGGEAGRLAELGQTPQRVAEHLRAFQAGEGEVVPVDPAEGRVLEALGLQPTLWERFRQGGAVGYVVVALGIGGLLVALGQYLYLLRVTVTLRRQLGDLERPRGDNPLGRVLARFHAFGAGHVPEALEARLDEALLAEQPRLERGQGLVKMLAAVAPLLGLLGTVTGMIVTFQSITVFGTGDPQLMAGGISQALVTTVLGLITAVPLLFAHTALSSRSRSLIGTLEGRASAVLADTLEAGRVASPSETPRHADALA
ncbi:MotA/TolQ/ExbB proton channel family protein [Halomonas maura]|uniref:MotA/TolQ/ExbB proton channel family protein n=1 Tax=Halomonas maura TaxID=117606 RepID=UPI0025B30581|nr:MotA/TolQ/ExbB proton channel family protein [Halomonas maura]MDN3555688.1 MotA/TolQ/ExbB proton channel family protein [Halomonas maura]